MNLRGSLVKTCSGARWHRSGTGSKGYACGGENSTLVVGERSSCGGSLHGFLLIDVFRAIWRIPEHAGRERAERATPRLRCRS